MKKEYQIQENAEVLYHHGNLSHELDIRGMQYIAQLRTCSATVWATDSYYVLKSYNTIVACIDAHGTCYDFLRYVYGYTATSAQHITKFCHDYGCGTKYTWREV